MKKLVFFLVLNLCGIQIFCNPGNHLSGSPGEYLNRKDSLTGDSIDFFSSDEPLDITLSFDMRKFLESRNQPRYMKASIILKDEETNGFYFEDSIKIKVRGKMRREYCGFPPMMLKFKNDGTGIPYNGNLKLVTPCMRSKHYETYVLKEYLVYRLLNHVTRYSLKTRLVRITMKDNRPGSKSYTSYAFLIENEKHFAERTNALLVKNPNLGQRNMIPDIMARIALFNYMVGNTDWAIPRQHNIIVLSSNELMSNKGIPVVYDFDHTGLVSSPYATPTQELPIKHVRERYYVGLCEHGEELFKAVDDFEELKDKFLGTISEFEYLPENDRKITKSYINSFFKMYKNKDALADMINRTCK